MLLSTSVPLPHSFSVSCAHNARRNHISARLFFSGELTILCKSPSVLPVWWLEWKPKNQKKAIDKMMLNRKMILLWRHNTSTQENYAIAFCVRLDKPSCSTLVNDYVASHADVTPDTLKYRRRSGWLPGESQLESVGTTRTEYTAVGKSPAGNSTHRHLKKEELWVLPMYSTHINNVDLA